MTAALDEVRRFLARIAPPAGQDLELRMIVPEQRPSQFFCRTTDEAARLVERFSGTANIYISACPRFRRGGRTEDVDTVVGAWADLDFHQLDPTNRDLALEFAYRRIETLGLQPTMLVHTGNGLQAWWLFAEPEAITDARPAEWFEAINRGIAQRLGGDAVHDLARVLRVPGTMNLPDAKKRARNCVPVMARLLVVNGPRHAIPQLASLAAPISRRPPRGGRNEELSSVDRPAVLEAFHALLSRVGPHHPLSRTWHGRRQLKDGSRSSFDMALAYQLARLGVRRPFAAAVLRSNPNGKGIDATDQYIDRTLERAYEWRLEFGGR